MEQKQKTILSWSTGKDSAWTLHKLKQDPSIELVGLFSSINKEFQRVAMHAARVELLKQQAKVAGTLKRPLSLDIISLPFPCSNDDYQKIMENYFKELVERGVEQIAFGDLFLQDVRDYRIKQLEDTGLKPIFPLWGMDTKQLSQTFVDNGVKAVITCINPKKLPHNFCGKDYNQTFLTDLSNLSSPIDPCGENGEFHTFVYDAPCFYEPINITTGEIVERGGFMFADVALT